MATKPTLSREYIFIPLAEINFTFADLNLHRIAFTAAGVEPGDEDWVVAEKVGVGHDLYRESFGTGAVALLVGPARGDDVTTNDLDAGIHQTWVEVSTAASDERVVRVAGTVTITATGS